MSLNHSAVRALFIAPLIGLSLVLPLSAQGTAKKLKPAVLTVHIANYAFKPPAATVHVDLPDFIRLISGELSSLVALVEGRVDVEGDVMLAARLGDMFGTVELTSIIADD